MERAASAVEPPPSTSVTSATTTPTASRCVLPRGAVSTSTSPTIGVPLVSTQMSSSRQRTPNTGAVVGGDAASASRATGGLTRPISR